MAAGDMEMVNTRPVVADHRDTKFASQATLLE